MGLFSFNLGVMDAVSAEVQAILKACVLCMESVELRRKSMVIVSDSKLVVSWVEGNGLVNMDCSQAISEIHFMLTVLSNTTVVYNPRACNSLADRLAKKGSAEQEDILLWCFDRCSTVRV